jgi:hypothetical protein
VHWRSPTLLVELTPGLSLIDRFLPCLHRAILTLAAPKGRMISACRL